MSIFLTSFVIGFSVAALPGAVQATVFRSSLAGNAKEGLRLASGAATADAALMLLSYLGLSQFVTGTDWLMLSLGAVGVAFMLYLGIGGIIGVWKRTTQNSNTRLKTGYFTGILLVLLHPATLLFYISVSGSVITNHNLTLSGYILSSIMILFSSFSCFVIVTLIAATVRKYGTIKLKLAFEMLASILLIVFAVKLLIGLL